MSLTVTAFPIPLVGLVQPQGIATGSDGNLWFTETGADRIGRMTPAGVVTEFSLPAIPLPAWWIPDIEGTPPPGPVAITAGPDGALWFVGMPGEVGRITTAGVVSEYALPAVPPGVGTGPVPVISPAEVTSITVGPDGALWFAGVPGEIGRITTSGVITEFAVPKVQPRDGLSPGTAGSQVTPLAIVSGPDGALWFTGVPGEIARITTAGAVTEFDVPAIPAPVGSSPGTTGSIPTPEAIAVGPDGALWFTGVAGAIGRITTTGTVTEYATSGFSPEFAIATGPDGNLWFTLATETGTSTATGGNPKAVESTALGRITPQGVFTSFPVPGNFLTLADLTPGPNGNLWFTEQEDDKTSTEQPALGEITPAGVTTLHPIARGITLDPKRGVDIDPTAITTGPDGALWFTENTAIGRITTDGTISQFPVMTPGFTPGDITVGSDGALWFTEYSTIGRVTTDGKFSFYYLPPNTEVGSITRGADGNVWFTEYSDYANGTGAVGRITPAGVIKTFGIPLPKNKDFSLGTITTGAGGKLWFTGDYFDKRQIDHTFIGQITARGKMRLFALPTTSSDGGPGGFHDARPFSLISGPDGKLWFDDQVQKTLGIARISTAGDLAGSIPAHYVEDLTLRASGQVWFTNSPDDGVDGQLSVATRSGIVVTSDLPGPRLSSYYAAPRMTVGPDGNLWYTDGISSISRVSGLDSPVGSLDYRQRPKRAPDYGFGPSSYVDHWTNVSSSAQPTFAGVARPGAELTLWVQKQGESQPVPIGHVHANHKDGSWTLKSRVRLSDGSYAVTASQKGDTGPPSMLYTLDAGGSSVSSQPLVIAAKRSKKGAGV